jgi:hypothetical protein
MLMEEIMKKLVVVLGVAALLSACDDGGGGGEVELDANQKATVETGSRALVTAGADMRNLKTDPGNDAAFTGLNSAFGNASSLWGTKMSAKGGTAYAALEAALETTGFALTAGCWTQDGNTVTYDCTEAGYGLVGTITVDGDTVIVDLTLTSQGNTFVYTGEITATDTLVDGWLQMLANIDQQGMVFDYDIDITYDSIVLADFCPVGGEIQVDVAVDIEGLEGLPAGAAGVYDYPDVRIVFGPACGDIAMF